MELFHTLFEMIKFQNRNPLPETQHVFKGLVDAIVPRTTELSEEKGQIQSYGALDLYTDEYVIWELDHNVSLFILIKNFNIYMANATAEMLNIAANQLIYRGENKKPIISEAGPETGIFAALEANDRFRALSLLEHLNINLASLPIPFLNNSGFVQAVTSILTLLAAFGYYSEWSGYGSTRLETVVKRKLENFPISWKQVQYPGPSKGYHALRGYLIDEFTEQED